VNAVVQGSHAIEKLPDGSMRIFSLENFILLSAALHVTQSDRNKASLIYTSLVLAMLDRTVP
jgi:hypothetical protein